MKETIVKWVERRDWESSPTVIQNIFRFRQRIAGARRDIFDITQIDAKEQKTP